MLAVIFYDVVKWLHIMAVVVAFGGVFTYPVWYRFVLAASPADRVMFHRAQGFIGQWVISPGLLVIVLAGVYMATDRDLWDEMWVTIPLLIAIGIGALGGVFFGPKEAKLAELAAAGGGPEYERIFAQVRNVGYVALTLVAIAAYMMVTKLGS
ncbi:MAG TPA: DUF2269 family protein [Solirubrobacteraceae bacterium]|jgi:hypothetical protein